jgi:hypothetical protein
MVAQKAELDRIHYKPIAVSTEEKLEQAKRMWLDYFTLILQSQKAAEDTLAPDAPFPELAAVKQMIYFLATTGQSRLGIAGRTGWSLHTTRLHIGRVFSMVPSSFLLSASD